MKNNTLPTNEPSATTPPLTLIGLCSRWALLLRGALPLLFTLFWIAPAAATPIPIPPANITPSTPVAELIGYPIARIADGNTTSANGFVGHTLGTIQLDLVGAPYDLRSFELWNDVNIEDQGIKDFTLTFYDSSNNQIGPVLPFSALNSTVGVQTFPLQVQCVARVELTVSSFHGDYYPIEIREVSFTHEPDSTAPIITACPTDRQVTNCEEMIPDLTSEVVASDDCSGSNGLTITQTPPAGTVVQPGIHPIVIEVRDAAGNHSYCFVNYTVIAPKILLPGVVWNTGLDASGALLPDGVLDPHYTLTTRPSSGPNNAIAVANHPAWTANSASPASKWIATITSLFDRPGTYVYETEFDMPDDCEHGAVQIEGRWSSDNSVTLQLDSRSNPPVAVSTAGYATWTSFNLTGITPGPHTAYFTVNNGHGPTGLRVEWDAYCTCPPSTDCIPPVITAQPIHRAVNKPLSSTDYARFTVFATGTPVLHYNWFRNNVALVDTAGSIEGANTATLTIKTDLSSSPNGIDDEGIYTVNVWNDCGEEMSSGAKMLRSVTIDTTTIIDGMLHLGFESEANMTYHLQRREAFTDGTFWESVKTFFGFGTDVVAPEPVISYRHRFYQVLVEP